MGSVNPSPSTAGSLDQRDFDVERLIASPSRQPAHIAPSSTTPPLGSLQSAADAYFKYCHNQPYAVFHEQSFRDKLASGTLPTHLFFAFLATVTRFSPDPQFRDNKFQAIEAYAAESWKSIILPWNGVENAAEISTVQAILLLGVIDYTGALLPNPDMI
jgi:hypothetical protein